MKQTFKVTIESGRRVTPEVIVAVLAQESAVSPTRDAERTDSVRSNRGTFDAAGPPPEPVYFQGEDLVGAVGIEPTTFGLKGRCSTTELRP